MVVVNWRRDDETRSPQPQPVLRRRSRWLRSRAKRRWLIWRNNSTSTPTRSRNGAASFLRGCAGVLGADAKSEAAAPAIDVKTLHASDKLRLRRDQPPNCSDDTGQLSTRSGGWSRCDRGDARTADRRDRHRDAGRVADPPSQPALRRPRLSAQGHQRNRSARLTILATPPSAFGASADRTMVDSPWKLIPASCSCSIPMIRSSVNREGCTVGLLV